MQKKKEEEAAAAASFITFLKLESENMQDKWQRRKLARILTEGSMCERVNLNNSIGITAGVYKELFLVFIWLMIN